MYKARDQYARIFALYVSLTAFISTSRAGSRIRESICALWKIRGVEREFSIGDGDVLIVGRISIFQRLTQYRAMREDFYIPQWNAEQENYGIVAPMEIRAANFIRAPLC